MGRRRTRDFDLAPGWRRMKGRLYFQPTTVPARDEAARMAFTLPDGPMVYFVRAKNSCVKIGFTSSRRLLTQRMASLRANSPLPLTLIGAITGTLDDEARAHATLRAWRRSGEWFGPSSAVTSFVRYVLRHRRIPELSNPESIVKNPGMRATESAT